MKKSSWKDLEYTVARIHDACIPLGEVIWSNEIEDVDTGESRQIDVTVKIRDQNGIDRLVAFECRNRKGLQDVTWIEQLIAKKNSIGADVLVAVTKNGLTRPAKIKAMNHDIYIRRVDELTKIDVLNIVNNQFSLNFTHYTFKGYNAFYNNRRLFDCENSMFRVNNLKCDFKEFINRAAVEIKKNIIEEYKKDNSIWARYLSIGEKLFKISTNVFSYSINDNINIELWFSVKFVSERYYPDKKGQYLVETGNSEPYKEAEYYFYDYEDQQKKLSMIYNLDNESVCYTAIYTEKPKNYGFIYAQLPALLYPCKSVSTNYDLPGEDLIIVTEISEFYNLIAEELIDGQQVVKGERWG